MSVYVAINLDRETVSRTCFDFLLGQISLALLDAGIDINVVRPVISEVHNCAVWYLTETQSFHFGYALAKAYHVTRKLDMIPAGVCAAAAIDGSQPLSMYYRHVYHLEPVPIKSLDEVLEWMKEQPAKYWHLFVVDPTGVPARRLVVTGDSEEGFVTTWRSIPDVLYVLEQPGDVVRRLQFRKEDNP